MLDQPVAVIVSNYHLPTRQLYRYRGDKLARYEVTIRTAQSKQVQARFTYHNYDVIGPTVHTVTATIRITF